MGALVWSLVNYLLPSELNVTVPLEKPRNRQIFFSVTDDKEVILDEIADGFKRIFKKKGGALENDRLQELRATELVSGKCHGSFVMVCIAPMYVCNSHGKRKD